MALLYNGNQVKTIYYNGNQTVTKVVYNGQTVWEAVQQITSTGTVSFYENGDYPIQVNYRQHQAIGNTGYDAYSPAYKRGAIVIFDFTNVNSDKIDTTKNAILTLHFTENTYLSGILKSDLNAITPKYGNNSKRNATKWASFFGQTGQAHGGTISGNDLIITIPGATLQTAATSLLNVDQSEKLLTLGLLHRSNVPRLYDTGNHPTLSYYYSA